MLSRLPSSGHVPSPSAGLCLAGAALLLIPVDLALSDYGADHPDVFATGTRVETRVVRGVGLDVEVDELVVLQPWWADLGRVAVPLAALTVLAVLGRIDRRDAGLTLGTPRVTAFWVVAPAVVVPAVGLVAVLVAAGLVRWAGLPPPAGLGETMTPRAFWEHGYVWRAFGHACLLTPLFEDTVYRGVLAPALERLGGARLVVLGSGVAWACLHVVYARPITWAPFYAASGMLGAWVFLRARSLVPLFVFHAAWNAAVLFGYDLLVLRTPGFIPAVFGWPPGPAGG